MTPHQHKHRNTTGELKKGNGKWKIGTGKEHQPERMLCGLKGSQVTAVAAA